MAADAAATSALFWAARLADGGVQHQQLRIMWHRDRSLDTIAGHCH
jgi:hypothetical protein